MEKRMNTGRRRSGGWARRRRGFILVMALIVILVGAALTVGMLVLTEGFSRGSIFQRMAYEQHTVFLPVRKPHFLPMQTLHFQIQEPFVRDRIFPNFLRLILMDNLNVFPPILQKELLCLS